MSSIKDTTNQSQLTFDELGDQIKNEYEKQQDLISASQNKKIVALFGLNSSTYETLFELFRKINNDDITMFNNSHLNQRKLQAKILEDQIQEKNNQSEDYSFCDSTTISELQNPFNHLPSMIEIKNSFLVYKFLGLKDSVDFKEYVLNAMIRQEVFKAAASVCIILVVEEVSLTYSRGKELKDLLGIVKKLGQSESVISNNFNLVVTNYANSQVELKNQLQKDWMDYPIIRSCVETNRIYKLNQCTPHDSQMNQDFERLIQGINSQNCEALQNVKAEDLFDNVKLKILKDLINNKLNQSIENESQSRKGFKFILGFQDNFQQTKDMIENILSNNVVTRIMETTKIQCSQIKLQSLNEDLCKVINFILFYIQKVQVYIYKYIRQLMVLGFTYSQIKHKIFYLFKEKDFLGTLFNTKNNSLMGKIFKFVISTYFKQLKSMKF